jgi:two-component system, repressor protein LuxO
MQKFPAYAVLIVEDVWPLALAYQAIAKRLDCKVTVAETAQAALRLLEQQTFECALVDLGLPDMHGFELMAQLLALQPDCAVIVITADEAVDTAVQATHAGAADFLQKPVDPDRLHITLRNTLAAYHLKTQVAELEAQTPSQFAGFVGKSAAMRAVYQMLQTVATSRAPVMVTGESGTGKELAAKAIHDLSPRASKPYVAINCAAIAKDLIESELFGHIKGAYTGAHNDRKGAFLEADGGTLFLDEIAEMSLDVQAKVLRALQSGEVRRLGDTKLQQVNIRVVCATHRNLQAMVQAQTFREDLYYRLHVVSIELPALRERGDDVALIAHSVLHAVAKEDGKAFERFDPAALRLMAQHDWPGNVRELINLVRAVVALYDGTVVQAEMVQAQLRKGADRTAPRSLKPIMALEPSHSAHADGLVWPQSHRSQLAPPVHALEPSQMAQSAPPLHIRPLADVEREAIEQAIAALDGNVALAAQALKVNASTVYRKIAQWSAAPASRPP